MPKIVDTEQYKKELLQKSFDLFAQKGYAALTTRELAQELGVSTGTLYHYFPSKAALFEQLVEELCQQDVVKATVEIKKAKTLTAKLEALGKFMETQQTNCIKQMFLWIEYCQQQEKEQGEKTQFFERIDERYHQAVIDVIGVKDPAIAWLVLTMINGLIIEKLWGNSHVSLTEHLKLLGELITAHEEKKYD
ncbi:TetR family transcriptional regulator [Aphanothece hegewaldii CCALA 016]|uniref:TetR family transcriptional regulator n=1 Tax=Aphanothece hegewaldii CCALA 016 TaxID=2107694 RepID=A0A2T1LY03_9CHRO|nr:TetR/AcrR family transcriptional regulator [Aphanothece hegewaldii]PSF37267.1 TetR family transcriptional regulator [Aphanothece hegewaldii CCALA 016]